MHNEIKAKTPDAGVRFLVSFVVDARGAVMSSRRHSGLRLIIPPLATSQPTRVQCKLVSPVKLTSAPPLSETDALAARVLDFGPTRLKFDTSVSQFMPVLLTPEKRPAGDTAVY